LNSRCRSERTRILMSRSLPRLLFDSTGRAYIDASGGAAVSCIGHSHPEVLAALHAQLDKLTYAHTSFFTSEAAAAALDTIVDRLTDALDAAIASAIAARPTRHNIEQ
jgi:4-aminobutyrate aminotransferase-like enzyme